VRRLSWPIALLHRHYVPAVHLLGAEQLADLPPSVVFAPTHRSFADLPTLQRALRESPARWRWNRLVVAAAAGILADAGMLGRLAMVVYGLFPLRQYSGREASLRQLVSIVDAGNSLLLFPQGRHTLPAEEVALAAPARFKPGVAHLAVELGLPAVPVGIAGDEAVIPGRVPPGYRGRVIAGVPLQLRHSPVAVAFGAPLTPRPGESSQAFTARLESAAFALAREAEARLREQAAATGEAGR
jgi:1-acyl-sn-glycerol-3-phosphate acyltransferase